MRKLSIGNSLAMKRDSATTLDKELGRFCAPKLISLSSILAC